MKPLSKLQAHIRTYGARRVLGMLARNIPKYANAFAKTVARIDVADHARRARNAAIGLSASPQEPNVRLIPHEDGLMFPDTESYERELKHHLIKRQTFEECLSSGSAQKKEYLDLKIGAYFQVFNQKKATFETLKSFRQHFPDAPVYLLSDKGEDFSEIARHFSCDYEYADVNIAYWPCKDIVGWLARLHAVCKKYQDCDWILLLEDDVRVRDRISKPPRGHLVGQGGGDGLNAGKQISAAAKAFLRDRYPGLEINGISGCGGSLFHRESFERAYENIAAYDVKALDALDHGLTWATDFALTFFFLMNGLTVRRWLDLSEEARGNYGPASAFDHQYKRFYKQPLTKDDLDVLSAGRHR